MEYELMIKELKKKLKKRSKHFKFNFEKTTLNSNETYDYCEELFDNILKEFTPQQLEKYDLIHKLKVGFVSDNGYRIISIGY